MLLDHPEGGQTKSSTKDKVVYKMIGNRNSLGKQGFTSRFIRKVAEPGKNPAVAYLQLDTWATDRETLALDLARSTSFPSQARSTVWFFRGEQAVWEEKIRWPGYK